MVSKPGKLFDVKEISDTQLKSVIEASEKNIGTKTRAIILFVRMNRSILGSFSFCGCGFCLPCFSN